MAHLRSRNHSFGTGMHLLVWAILFSLPYLLSDGQFANFQNLLLHSWFPLINYAILFYLNYLLFIDKYLFGKKILVFVILNVLLVALLLLIDSQLHIVFREIRPEKMFFFKEMKKPPYSIFIYKNAISLIVPVIFSIAVRSTDRWLKTESEKKESEKEKLKSELQHLRYQLQPHFFFNSLNNIYSLVDASPEKAKEAIHSLGKLMRYFLHDSEKVKLSDELEFMNRYIDLMSLRLNDRTKVSVHFNTGNREVRIAPLLFISLIENAFKHGVSATRSSSIGFEMKWMGEELCFISENENFPKSHTDESGSGIGLGNLKKRLELLYPGKYNLQSTVTGHTFHIVLSIDFSTSSQTPFG